ncbi:MAG: hypothetical protein ACFFG0_04525 [Candidatus Thorarchaeota archaeon]
MGTTTKKFEWFPALTSDLLNGESAEDITIWETVKIKIDHSYKAGDRIIKDDISLELIQEWNRRKYLSEPHAMAKLQVAINELINDLKWITNRCT